MKNRLVITTRPTSMAVGVLGRGACARNEPGHMVAAAGARPAQGPRTDPDLH